MIKYENQCVDCGLPCLGSRCSHRNVLVYYCDVCGDEIDIDDVYEVDDEDLCEDCLKEMFKKEV